MAVWSKVDNVVEKHSAPQPMLAAAIRCNFAVNAGGIPLDRCGIYRRDPAKFPDEPNILPEQIAKAARRKGRR